MNQKSQNYMMKLFGIRKLNKINAKKCSIKSYNQKFQDKLNEDFLYFYFSISSTEQSIPLIF